MIEKNTIISIFQLRIIDRFSIRKTALQLSIHRNTVKKYTNIIENNISSLKVELISKGKCNHNNVDMFIKDNWEDYNDKITFIDKNRKKRKLTPKIKHKLSDLAESLDTRSANKIYNYIHTNLPYDDLAKLSYSSIWRILKN